MPQFPRFRIRTLLILVGVASIALALLPLEPWRESRAIKSLAKAPFASSLEFRPAVCLLGIAIPWRQTVVGASITLYGSGEVNVAPTSASFRDFEALVNLEKFTVAYVGSNSENYAIPIAPRNPATSHLSLTAVQINKETIDSFALNLPNLKSIALKPHRDSSYSTGTYEKLFSLSSLVDVTVECTRLDGEDILALSKSKVNHLSIYDSDLSESAIAYLGDCRSLERLEIHSQYLTEGCFDSISRLLLSTQISSIDVRLPFSGKTSSRVEELMAVAAQKGVMLSISRY